MAKLIPPIIGEHVRSNAERKVFKLLQEDPDSEDWIVLHSLYLARHQDHPCGEIDFVILIPNLINLVIEIKGGRVYRDNGLWYFVNRYGIETSKTEGPIEQANRAMFTLRSYLKDKAHDDPLVQGCLWASCVIFPDCSFPFTGPDLSDWQIIDRDKLSRGLRRSLLDTAHQAARNLGSYRSTRQFSPPCTRTTNRIKALLRGDFENGVSLSEVRRKTEEELEELTSAQLALLIHQRRNKRILCEGAAGTGKTYLAKEAATTQSRAGKKVGVLCYNSLLAHWYKQQFAQDRNVTVSTFHELLTQLAGVGLDGGHERPGYFTEELPLLAFESIESKGFAKFDCMVVDEAQDLISENYLLVMNEMLCDGLANGHWFMAGDFERQGIFSGLSPEDAFRLLDKYSFYVHSVLDTNCRNTLQVSEFFNALTGYVPVSVPKEKVSGPPVDVHYYKNKNSGALMLQTLLDSVLKSGVSPSEITILSPRRLANSLVSHIAFTGELPIVDLKDYPDALFGTQHLTFSTIHSFKGLENTFIVLTDLEDVEDTKMKEISYVGMSRARFKLEVIAHKRIEPIISSLLSAKK